MSVAEGSKLTTGFKPWYWYLAEAPVIFALLLFVLKVGTGEADVFRWIALIPLALLIYGVDQLYDELYLKYGKEVKP